MEFFKFAFSVAAGSAIAAGMLGGVIKLLQIVQIRAAVSSTSKALSR